MGVPSDDWAILHRWVYTKNRIYKKFSAYVLEHDQLKFLEEKCILLGSVGDEVKKLQNLIGEYEDGFYGQITLQKAMESSNVKTKLGLYPIPLVDGNKPTCQYSSI